MIDSKPPALEWPNCLNTRDLAGLPTRDGGRIRPGALIRSDNLTRLSTVGVEAVRAAGVTRIVDVRSPLECADDRSPFAGEPLYVNRPLARDGDPYDPAWPMERQYAEMLDQNPDLLAAAVAAVADAPPGGVVVHCHSGKDRSGMVVALVLTLVGVAADFVVADYTAVDQRMRDHLDDLLLLVADPVERGFLAESFSARPESMRSALGHLDARYGGAEAYLLFGGLTVAQAGALRSRLVG
ncbi:tyrosine-protein phosphatase [Actinopolymorpha rutila]|uniref:Protein tyrosine/serine phosphatase n=1 Tax=Actinopolymorpha rutila TaxID=446787 RepID=A0A852ZGG0_9ACTN|nr:tyrosine-protein phosphatase [Actinopolymorpha rutila]NYH90762.1 protein tyrosine/serine phosphatase [Actinopolymorpha rutila]